MKKRILAWLLVCCMMLTLMPTRMQTIAYAETTNLDITTGDIVISASGDYVITGSTSTHNITVNPGVLGVNITLKDVSIDVSAIDNKCAFDIGDGASVDVTLADGTTNTFKSGASKAGIKVEAPTTGAAGAIVINGITGSLIAVGGTALSGSGSGAGIGSNGRIAGENLDLIPVSGNITINGGVINATGGVSTYYAGAGIGSGGGYSGFTSLYDSDASDGGNTTIHGGIITATGGSATWRFSGAGIGSGAAYESGTAGDIYIDGGTVNATGGNGAFIGAGIGKGSSNFGIGDWWYSSLTITGTAVVNASTPNGAQSYGSIGRMDRITIGESSVVTVMAGATSAWYNDAAIWASTLFINDTPTITVLSSYKEGDRTMYTNYDVVPIKADTFISSTVSIIAGIFSAPLSTTDSTDITISGGNAFNTKVVSLPENYASFATTVDSSGRYTGIVGTKVLQDSTTSVYEFNVLNTISSYNVALAATPVDQTAPTGLAGVAPTVNGGTDGKITGTTALMEYKLQDAASYTAVTANEITGLAAGTYNVRYAANTSFNVGAAAVVVVEEGSVDQTAPINLASVAPTTYGGTNGKITGTTALMEYQLQGSSSYTAATATEITGLAAGTYNVRYAAKAGFHEGAAAVVVIAEGPNAEQTAPTGLSSVAPTTYGGTNGKITGTTTLMEYQLQGAASYSVATATEITGLAAGTYNVRYAAKTGFHAGTAAVVVIAEGPVDQAAPTGLAGVAPTTYGGTNGKITGTTALMEYQLQGAGSYSVATATEITGLAAGTYNVRYAARPGFHTGSATVVVIPDGVIPDGVERTEGDFVYIVSDGEATIVNYIGAGGDVVIPAILNGYPVISVGYLAFYDCTLLTSVIIPDGVISIGESAFCNCNLLTSVIIPDSVISIGESAFKDCTSLTSIIIPDSVISIGDSAFKGCTSLTSVTIPDSVTNIYEEAFSGCISLTSVTIPDSVEVIDEEAFSGCTSLTSVTIPSSVTSLGEFVFVGCTSLTEINVEETNQSYSSVNGILYNLDKTILVECPGGMSDSISIPNSVNIIMSGAFAFCTSLTEVVLPNSLTEVVLPNSVSSIGHYAFYGCSALTNITILKNVTEIGEDVFTGCESLTIYGNDSSTAKSYASDRDIPFIIIPLTLDELKAIAHEILNTSLAGLTEGDYTAANWTILIDYKADGDTAIDAATDTDGVTTAQTTATNEMSGVKTTAQLVAEYTSAVDAEAFITLLNTNALGLTLTNYAGLDAIGKTEVGAAMLVVDTFADKAAVQIAVTTAIADAKTAYDARIGEAALVLAYTNAADAGTFVTLLNTNALGLTLTNYAGLDATGKTEVGEAMLVVDTFADKAAVQTAVTTAIANAKTASDARIGEAALVLEYTNAPDAGTFVTLLNTNALGLILTNYAGLDATGRTEVGVAMLVVDTFADKAAVQTAVTNAIADAKTAYDARIEEAALVLEYTNAADAGTFVTLLNTNVLGLILTNYVGLDATGRTEVGAAMLVVDTFADKAAVQTAVTNAIADAKTAYDARIEEAALVLEYTNAADEGTFVTLLNTNALGLTLTNYAGLDATGRTEVGAAMLVVDTFADKAAVQTAVTTAIADAKTAYDARIADSATITNVKALIEGATYTWNQAEATKEADIKTKIETIISGLALNGVATTVTKVFYTPAVAGNTGTPAGTNGTYTFTVGLSKGDVTNTTATITMTIIATAFHFTEDNTTNPSGSDSGSNNGTSEGIESDNSSETPSNPYVEILVNDTVVDAGIKVDTVVEDKTITTVSLDEKKVNEKITTEGKSTVITIPITHTSSDVLISELNGQMIKNLEKQQAIIEITTDTATYTLPASQIDIDAVSKQLGKNIELKDIIVNIEIAKTPDETVKLVENAANKGTFTVIASPVEFNVRCTFDNKTIDVSKFNDYVERTVAIPAGISKNKITTGVVVDADGTMRHVPTKITIIDGAYYAQIKSLTNSTYAVIWNPITYKDVVKHPSKKVINDLGSRMVISGTKNDLFRPDEDITRAEFVAMLVTSLGLTPGTGDTVYTDVKLKDWYCKYIEAGYEYGIITGDAKTKFRPKDKITTQEAMTMLTNAMKITGLKVTFKKGEAKKLIAALAKSGQTQVWADNSMASCIKSGVVSVKNKQKIAPKDKINRAEAAVMIRNLLRKSNLI